MMPAIAAMPYPRINALTMSAVSCQQQTPSNEQEPAEDANENQQLKIRQCGITAEA
jgi:hypothetical protein